MRDNKNLRIQLILILKALDISFILLFSTIVAMESSLAIANYLECIFFSGIDGSWIPPTYKEHFLRALISLALLILCVCSLRFLSNKTKQNKETINTDGIKPLISRVVSNFMVFILFALNVILYWELSYTLPEKKEKEAARAEALASGIIDDNISDLIEINGDAIVIESEYEGHKFTTVDFGRIGLKSTIIIKDGIEECLFGYMGFKEKNVNIYLPTSIKRISQWPHGDNLYWHMTIDGREYTVSNRALEDIYDDYNIGFYPNYIQKYRGLEGCDVDIQLCMKTAYELENELNRLYLNRNDEGTSFFDLQIKEQEDYDLYHNAKERVLKKLFPSFAAKLVLYNDSREYRDIVDYIKSEFGILCNLNIDKNDDSLKIYASFIPKLDYSIKQDLYEQVAYNSLQIYNLCPKINECTFDILWDEKTKEKTTVIRINKSELNNLENSFNREMMNKKSCEEYAFETCFTSVENNDVWIDAVDPNTFHLTLNEDLSITRDEHDGFKDLSWQVYFDGEHVTDFLAKGQITLKKYQTCGHGENGKRTIYLTANINGNEVRVSNIIEFYY